MRYVVFTKERNGSDSKVGVDIGDILHLEAEGLIFRCTCPNCVDWHARIGISHDDVVAAISARHN